MEGLSDNNQHGISYRTIQKIFHLLSAKQRVAEIGGEAKEEGPAEEVAFKFAVEVGMLEIYNDEIYDSINTEGSTMEENKQGALNAGGKGSLDIRRNKDGRIEVPNLTKENVGTIEEVMELLKRGNSNRATASTDMNEHSSRSHMVLIVDVLSGLGDTQSNKGTLFLVDLAGSERVRKSNLEGDHPKEAGFINKSLAALGNVVEALDRKASQVPYHDSKLTYMLQDSLGGNSRTMMIVNICPDGNSYDESVHALQFATRVRRIQIGAAQRNMLSNRPIALGGSQFASSSINNNVLANDESVISHTLKGGDVSTNKTPGEKDGRRAFGDISNNTNGGRPATATKSVSFPKTPSVVKPATAKNPS